MSIEKTRRYYALLTDEDLCACADCRNYRKEIRSSYPELADFLNTWGVDAEKPLEVIPIGPGNGMMFYSGAQYVVIGSSDGFRETAIGNVEAWITDAHPMTDVREDHFVIEVSPIRLKWSGG